MTLEIRDAAVADMQSLHAIYTHHVLHGFGTFDETPPSLGEFEDKWRGIVACGLSWLVASAEGGIVGYAYASPFRPRSGYRYSVEDSVYIRDEWRGKGAGKALLRPLIARCEAVGARQVLAVIGDSENAASIALHRNHGFEHAGTIKGVGYKLGRWVDVVMMQRPLNGGNKSQPTGAGPWRAP